MRRVQWKPTLTAAVAASLTWLLINYLINGNTGGVYLATFVLPFVVVFVLVYSLWPQDRSRK